LRGFRLQYREIRGQTTPERCKFFLQIMCQCFSWKSNTSSLPYRAEHPSKCCTRLQKGRGRGIPEYWLIGVHHKDVIQLSLRARSRVEKKRVANATHNIYWIKNGNRYCEVV
jgi:hypothetical protein